METITLENENGIALLTLNRPEVLNSINTTLIAEVRAAVAKVAKNDDARVLVITGAGRGLCAGADLVIASHSASFVQVFGPRLGLIPDLGCTWHLPRLVGRARALGLALTGDKLPAETAAEWGLIWKCVKDTALMEAVMTLATKLAKGPASAFAEIRKAIDAGARNGYAEQLDYERDVQGMLGDHPNFAEGVKAFLTKKEPAFKARSHRQNRTIFKTGRRIWNSSGSNSMSTAMWAC